MKTIYLFFILASMAILGSGCETLYGPAMSGSNMPYQARSAYHDENVDESWVSGSFHQGITYGSNEENNTLFQGSFHRSHVRKYLKANYGAFGYGGSYKTDISSVGTLSYMGIGARAAIAFSLPSQYVDFNVIGVQGVANGEFGQYDRFRADRDFYWGQLNTALNITSGFDIKTSHNSSIGIEQGLGYTGAPLTLNFTNSKFAVWSQVNLASLGDDWVPSDRIIWALGASFRVK